MINYLKREFTNGQTPFYQCLAHGGKPIGNILQEVNGFYYFYPAKNDGFLTEHMLLDLSRKLQALNTAWEMRAKMETGAQFEEYTPEHPPKP